jgi:hypothetical protein
MGAQQSVELSCIVDKLTHSPGESVKGCVYLKVQGPSLTQFEGITVTLAGVECLALVDNQVIPSGKKITIKQDISTFPNGIVEEGVHEFPFGLVLPHHQPQHQQDDDEESAEVPDLTHSRTSSSNTISSSTDLNMSSRSTGSLYDTSSLSLSQEHVAATATASRPVMYQIRASLKRKKGVSLTVDTDYRCNAQCADDMMAQ